MPPTVEPGENVTITSDGPGLTTVSVTKQSPQAKVHLIGIAFTSALTIAGLLGLWERLGLTADQVGVLLTTAGVLVTTLAHILLGTTPKVPE